MPVARPAAWRPPAPEPAHPDQRQEDEREPQQAGEHRDADQDEDGGKPDPRAWVAPPRAGGIGPPAVREREHEDHGPDEQGRRDQDQRERAHDTSLRRDRRRVTGQSRRPVRTSTPSRSRSSTNAAASNAVSGGWTPGGTRPSACHRTVVAIGIAVPNAPAESPSGLGEKPANPRNTATAPSRRPATRTSITSRSAGSPSGLESPFSTDAST